MTDVITDVEQITPEWLTQVLSEHTFVLMLTRRDACHYLW